MKNFWSRQAVHISVAIVVIGLTFAGGFSVGTHSRPEAEKVTAVTNKDEGNTTKVDFAAFWKAWNILNEKFVSSKSATTTDQDKMWGAITGLTASYKDPYTVFFPPEESKSFQSEISGSFEGVGMEVGIKDSIITVIAPLKGTPADKAGVLPGDKIIKIDSKSTEGLRVDEAVKLIRGKKDTQVTLTIMRGDKGGFIDIKVTRGVIAIPTIDTEVRTKSTTGSTTVANHPSGLQENGVFVIKLYTFSQNSPELFRGALRQFVESGSDKLILDLRGNPGGYLSAAVDMASWFLPAGKVIVTEDFGENQPSNIYRSRADSSGIFTDKLKFAILVNGGSASASEILAGALSEYGVAKLVGQTTYGKGSVQELIDITPDTSLKVTVARWLTPKGNSISLKGITPDVKVDMTADDVAKGRDPQMEAAFKLLTQYK